MAWGLSANMDKRKIEWDLWMVWSSVLDGYETLSTDGSGRPTEYRTYHRIYKRDIWYVGTRAYIPRAS